MAQKLSNAELAEIVADRLDEMDEEDLDSFEPLWRNVKRGAETLCEGLGN